MVAAAGHRVHLRHERHHAHVDTLHQDAHRRPHPAAHASRFSRLRATGQGARLAGHGPRLRRSVLLSAEPADDQCEPGHAQTPAIRPLWPHAAAAHQVFRHPRTREHHVGVYQRRGLAAPDDQLPTPSVLLGGHHRPHLQQHDCAEPSPHHSHRRHVDADGRDHPLAGQALVQAFLGSAAKPRTHQRLHRGDAHRTEGGEDVLPRAGGHRRLPRAQHQPSRQCLQRQPRGQHRDAGQRKPLEPHLCARRHSRRHHRPELFGVRRSLLAHRGHAGQLPHAHQELHATGI